MRRDLVLIGSATVARYITIGIMSIAIQLFFIDKVPDFYIALLSSIYWTVMLVFSPLWGTISDKLRERKMILVFTNVIIGILTALYYVVNTYSKVLILHICVAAFSSAYLPVVLALIADMTIREKMGRTSAVVNISSSLGFFISGYITAWILLRFNVKFLFIIGSVFTFLAGLLYIPVQGLEIVKVNGSLTLRSIIMDSLSIFREEDLLQHKTHLLIIALSLYYTSLTGIYSLIYVYMVRIGIPSFIVGVIYSFNTLFQILFMFPFGYLADIIGRKKVFLFGFIFSIGGPLGFMLSRTIIGFIITFSVIGTGFAAIISGVTPFLRDISRGEEGARMLSVINISRAIGFIIGPIIAGILVQVTSYQFLFLVTTIILALSAIMAVPVHEVYKP